MTKPCSPAKQPSSQQLQSDIRTRARAARDGMSQSERDIAAEKIAKFVIQSPWFQRSENIACYLSVPGEVDTWRIITRAWRMKKRIFAPVVKKNNRMCFQEIDADTALYRNSYGLYEPCDGDFISARELDIVITPVVAFDSRNCRIGMGGGYFDRTFAFLRHRNFHFHPKLVGVAFACQEVEEIAANPWDIQLFRIVTDVS
jgi:5-formyltetrahydrofolate cyclo-ligase